MNRLEAHLLNNETQEIAQQESIIDHTEQMHSNFNGLPAGLDRYNNVDTLTPETLDVISIQSSSPLDQPHDTAWSIEIPMAQVNELQMTEDELYISNRNNEIRMAEEQLNELMDINKQIYAEVHRYDDPLDMDAYAYDTLKGSPIKQQPSLKPLINNIVKLFKSIKIKSLQKKPSNNNTIIKFGRGTIVKTTLKAKETEKDKEIKDSKTIETD
jgi:hypothetical protein